MDKLISIEIKIIQAVNGNLMTRLAEASTTKEVLKSNSKLPNRREKLPMSFLSIFESLERKKFSTFIVYFFTATIPIFPRLNDILILFNPSVLKIELNCFLKGKGA